MTKKKIEKLSKIKDDLVFIDPVTMEKVCSLNECIEKFDSVRVEVITKRAKWLEVGQIRVQHQFHECSECKRKYISRKDKKANYGFWMAAVTGNFKEENHDIDSH
jgi:ferritin-like protein